MLKKVDITGLYKKKESGEKISMLTAYDCPTAQLLDEVGVDTILVGDSLSNVILGYKDTIPVTMDEMIHHTKAVARGVSRAMVIGDMPFMSFNISVEESIRNAGRFLKEGNAEAVKLEGGGTMAETVNRIVKAGIPVVGHLGLTPQTANMLGGYKVQGNTTDSALRILNDAMLLQDAGIFMLVLECVPGQLAAIISKKLRVPVIGIGAGVECDGQVLVINDILGIRSGFTPKFVKKYADCDSIIRKAVSDYIKDVTNGGFPDKEHSFDMPKQEMEKLRKLLISSE